ncbi:ABC transporter ATP-binding protein [Syntrophomonas erecta]
MIVLQAQKTSKSYGGQPVLQEVNLVIQEKERVGVVGVNGCGKSTLLKTLAGEIEPDSGQISLANSCSMAYLDQLPDVDQETTAWEAVMASYADLIEKRSLMRELEYSMAHGIGDLDKVMETYARVVAEYERDNGYACENMARRILDGLGFKPSQFDQAVATFSGGQKTRLNLARLLALSPDILLLDEPTNNLDMPSVEWLENYLLDYPGTVAVVSHDRRFLDRVVDRIIEVRQGYLFSYPGNYSRYVELKAADQAARQKSYEKQQDYINQTEEFIRRYKAGVKARQARGRQSQLERLQRVDRLMDDKNIGSWRLNCVESGQDVLRIEELAKSFDDVMLFSGLDLLLRRGERVALVGPNGCGKTTLLKIVMGEIKADQGSVTIGSRVIPGYFAQEFADLDAELTVLEEIVYNCDILVEQARNLLGRMLFSGDEVFKKVRDLSGGERGRLALLKLILAGANFLILDEPTNHLDIESRQAVENMLDTFPGTIFFVSHDRYFIDRIANEVLVMEDGRWQRYQGNYSDYCVRKEEQKKEKSGLAGDVPRISQAQQFREEQKRQERIRNRLEKDLEQVETAIMNLEERFQILQAMLSSPDLYQDEEQAREISHEYGQIEEQLNDAYEKWHNLAEKLAGISD